MGDIKKVKVNNVLYTLDLGDGTAAEAAVVAAEAAAASANAAAGVALSAASKAPYIGQNGNWWVWDSTASSGAGAYVDTNISADPETAKADKSDVDEANLVVAEAIAALRRDIDGIQKMLSENAGEMNAKSVNVEDEYCKMGQKLFDLVSSAPTELPMAKGLIRFNPSNGALYISKSVTNATSDWVRVQ